MKRSRLIIAILFNIAAVILILMLTEFFLESRNTSAESNRARLVFRHPEGFYVDDDDLGYRPAANFKSNVKFYFEDRLIFDVEYSTDGDGLRIPPPGDQRDGKEDCVLFFGGSYTFGAGVSDHETMPYLVGARSEPSVSVRNFGFGGYGPHQMLAAIENGLVERAAHCVPRYAIYQALNFHVVRSAGRFRSDSHGPRYRLSATGELSRSGNFDDRSLPQWLSSFLEKSAIITRYWDSFDATEQDLQLYHAIVHRAHRLLVERYPGIEFHVLYWDYGMPELFRNNRESGDFIVHRLTKLLPLGDQQQLESNYQIPHDGHPNARTHKLIADYVLREIL